MSAATHDHIRTMRRAQLTLPRVRVMTSSPASIGGSRDRRVNGAGRHLSTCTVPAWTTGVGSTMRTNTAPTGPPTTRDRWFHDEHGRLVVWQTPNLPLIVWAACRALGLAITQGAAGRLVDTLAF